ncbi:MAG: RHS repeat-associated core domain-containing protein [Bacteroidota bacterium]|nr:RHS repeat-associated core domain-containing protein [Bacteroidota bacterium]
MTGYYYIYKDLAHTTVCSTWDKGYRYGFNGKEIDKGSEGMGGGGSTYDYGFRIYNPSLGRFLSVDPLTASYPWYTPYQFAGNMPINCIDLDGLEQISVIIKPTTDFVVFANVTIKLTYIQVTSGNGAVHRIDAKAFSDKYKKGNKRLLYSELPTQDTEGIALSGRNYTLGMKAIKGNQRAISRLKAKGLSNLYVADIQFDYKIIQEENTTMEDAMLFMNDNIQGRGIIMEQMPFVLMKGSYGDNLNIFMRELNEYTNLKGGSDGFGSNEKAQKFIDNYIVITKKNIELDRTNTVFHEAGHNSASAHLHNQYGLEYEYEQEGTQYGGFDDSKYKPTLKNLLNIINDATNRGTINSSSAILTPTKD